MSARQGKRSRKVKTSNYDVADHLRTPAEMAAYLDAWMVEAPDDISGIAGALRNVARAIDVSQLAREKGLVG